jgi:hypothetical protein
MLIIMVIIPAALHFLGNSCFFWVSLSNGSCRIGGLEISLLHLITFHLSLCNCILVSVVSIKRPKESKYMMNSISPMLNMI